MIWGTGQLVIHTISLQLCRELPQIIPNQKVFLCIICIIHEIERKIKCKYGYARKKTAARASRVGEGCGADSFPFSLSYHRRAGETTNKAPQNGALAGNFFRGGKIWREKSGKGFSKQPFCTIIKEKETLRELTHGEKGRESSGKKAYPAGDQWGGVLAHHPGESDEYMQSLAKEVGELLEEMQITSPYITREAAALAAALGYCDDARKNGQRASRLQERVDELEVRGGGLAGGKGGAAEESPGEARPGDGEAAGVFRRGEHPPDRPGPGAAAAAGKGRRPGGREPGPAGAAGRPGAGRGGGRRLPRRRTAPAWHSSPRRTAPCGNRSRSRRSWPARRCGRSRGAVAAAKRAVEEARRTMDQMEQEADQAKQELKRLQERGGLPGPGPAGAHRRGEPGEARPPVRGGGPPLRRENQEKAEEPPAVRGGVRAGGLRQLF